MALLRILFIRATHSIYLSALSCSVTPSRFAICFTSRENISSACLSRSARYPFSLPLVSRLRYKIFRWCLMYRKCLCPHTPISAPFSSSERVRSGSSQPPAVQNHQALCNTFYPAYCNILWFSTVIVLKGGVIVECTAINRKIPRKTFYSSSRYLSFAFGPCHTR